MWFAFPLVVSHMNLYDSSYILGHLFLFFPFLRVEQVQEKKVKKISDMNVDPLKAMGNGSSSSNSISSVPYLANGGFAIPPGGLPSLKLPLVVVLCPSS